jgi:hypothetical protein
VVKEPPQHQSTVAFEHVCDVGEQMFLRGAGVSTIERRILASADR